MSGKEQHTAHSSHRISGFTLIELLIVIAIIAILAAILFPVFARARENARRSSCQSSMKQLGLSILQYYQDYDERPPVGSDPTAAWKMGVGWAGQIMSYVKSKQIFKCPSELGRPGVTPASNAQYVSYAYNPSLVKKDNNASSLAEVKTISAFSAPASTVLLSEITYNAFVLTDNELGSPTQNGPNMNHATGTLYLSGTLVQPTAMWSGVDLATREVERHLEGANYLAADGHVKWCKPEQISWGYNRTVSTAAQTNSPDGSGSRYAEGTQYAGADKHLLTMSHN